jgi:DNA-binding CsgD family transcriptional regulator
MMNSGSARDMLSRLSAREMQVLRLRCQGLEYAAIAIQLRPPIKENTVKTVMSNVYVKLALDGLGKVQRWEALFQFYCPALKEEWVVVPPPEGVPGQTEVIDQPDDIQAVSAGALVLVSQDADLVPWTPPQPPATGSRSDRTVGSPLPPPGPPARRPPPTPSKDKWFGRLGCLAAVILGAAVLALTALASWLYLQNQQLQPAHAVPTQTIVKASATQFVLPATQTPAIATVIVVVTAVPPPVTNTPEDSATPVPSTNTPVPSDTPLPTATATASVPLPFSDNFDKGLTALWKPQTGTWRMVNGRLTADPSDLMSLIVVGDENWTDYTVNVDVFNYDWNYPVRVIVRAAGGNYLAFQTNCCNTDWFLVSGPEEKSIAHFDKGGLKFSGFSGFMKDQIRVEVSGQTYSGYVDGKLYLQVQDATLTSGAVGLAFQYAFENTTQFDNFSVAAP